MKSNYRYDDVDIKWEYVVDFYNKDKVMSIMMVPKLTDRHITFPPFGAMRVNFAAQVLSHSVAAGINTLCSLKEMPDEASKTAEFIETFDELFNAFNSARLRSSYKYKSALLSENSGPHAIPEKLPQISFQIEDRTECNCTMHSWLADINL